MDISELRKVLPWDRKIISPFWRQIPSKPCNCLKKLLFLWFIFIFNFMRSSNFWRNNDCLNKNILWLRKMIMLLFLSIFWHKKFSLIFLSADPDRVSEGIFFDISVTFVTLLFCVLQQREQEGNILGSLRQTYIKCSNPKGANPKVWKMVR